MTNTHAIKHRSPPPRRQRGVATLFVAVVLLALITVSVFTANRHLVTDQQVAGNYYRAARAFFVAEAALDLTGVLMNDKATRDTWLTSSGGSYTGVSSAGASIRPTSAQLGAIAASAGTASALVILSPAEAGTTMSKVRVESRGCWQEPGQNLAACTTCSAACPNTAVVSQILAFDGALSGVPSAALTAKGNVDLGGSAIQITNTDPSTNGLTVHSGGTISPHTPNNLVTLPGTPPLASTAPNDSELSSISPDAFFEKFFGADKTSYKASADERITCGGVCNTSVNGKTGKVLWVDVPTGPSFTLNSTTTVGSLSAPVILIINGPVELRGSATVYGIVYSTSILWDNTGGGTSQIIGGAIAEGDFEANGTPNPTYNSTILNTLASGTGKFVKVPGSWRDF